MNEKTTHHIDIDEREVRVTCPGCGHEHTWEWNGSNNVELTFTRPCKECGADLELFMQVGAILTANGVIEEEGWL